MRGKVVFLARKKKKREKVGQIKKKRARSGQIVRLIYIGSRNRKVYILYI